MTAFGLQTRGVNMDEYWQEEKREKQEQQEQQNQENKSQIVIDTIKSQAKIEGEIKGEI